MNNKYKNLQGTIKLWCFTKWGNCDIICSDESSIDSADMIVTVDNKKIGFIFVTDKTTEFIKQQVISCRKECNKVYLITNTINPDNITKIDNDVRLLNISDKYGLGSIIEEL